MSRRCQLTGKSNNTANNVSHSRRRTKRVQKANVKSKRLYLRSEDRWITMKVSTSALRTIDKIGFDTFIRKNGIKV